MPHTERRKPDILDIQRRLEEITEIREPDKAVRPGDKVVTTVVDDYAKRLYTLYRMYSTEKGAAYSLSGQTDKQSESWRNHRKDALRNYFISEGCLLFFWARIAQIDSTVIDYPLNSLNLREGWLICTET